MEYPEGTTESSSSPEATVTEPVNASEVSSLVAERDALAREKAELQDLLLRQRAEHENIRRRTERERLETSEYAAMDAVKAFLPVLDDFGRALKTECLDKEYARGMELIYQRTLDTLRKLGLEPMETEGKCFDPHLHHAIEMVNSETEADQTILGEFQKGYYFKGRLLRPALVKVAVR